TTSLYTLSLHDALPIFAVVHEERHRVHERVAAVLLDELDDAGRTETRRRDRGPHVALEEVRQTAVALHDRDDRLDRRPLVDDLRSEEHTSELQSRGHLV